MIAPLFQSKVPRPFACQYRSGGRPRGAIAVLALPVLVVLSCSLLPCVCCPASERSDRNGGASGGGSLPKEGAAIARSASRVLITRCLECHGADRKGGLDLRTRRSLLAGGDSGRVVVAGRPSDSLLWQRVRNGEMPPDEPLAPRERETLRQWITAGVPYAAEPLDPYAFTSDRRAGYDWWSLQPVRRPRLPRGSSGAASRIDAFIDARLRAKGIRAVESADRATLIRRVTYDLTGLHPTPEDVDAFVRDPRPDAYERLVDRLLASPHYGERWARHWLDVVRFAESNGFERDRIRRNFWRYRDYVIASFNANTPFDVFATEQLAGDALRPDDPRMRIAVGFLAVGPKNDVPTVSELERLKTRQDELDDFVVGTMTTFTGLTVGCARCHDHKFDPIPSRDYYALTAVFAGCRHDPAVEVASEEERRRRAEVLAAIEEELKAARSERERLLDAAARRTFPADDGAAHRKRPLPPVDPRRNEDAFPAVTARYVRFTVFATNRGEPCLDELEVYGPDEAGNLALASRGAQASASSLLPGYAIHQIPHLTDGRYGNGHSWISNEPGRGWAQVDLGRPQRIERVVWGRDREGRYADRVPVAYRISVSLDGRQWQVVSGSWRRRPFPGIDVNVLRRAETLAALLPGEAEKLHRLDAAIAALEDRRKNLPPLPTTYSIGDGTGAERVPVLLRGDVRRSGPLVAAAALSAVRSLDPDLSAADGPGRRLKLARWLTDPRNPLTARVFVNRVWQWHFGRGIVATPNDFGFKGARPTHPRLLDELAADFVASGWDVKRLQRRIVLSEAYRRSSRFDAQAAAIDGGNQLLWRF
ncbi:MAG: DUF1549 domain-containing protein, partial [Planctomycetota bacterium]